MEHFVFSRYVIPSRLGGIPVLDVFHPLQDQVQIGRFGYGCRQRHLRRDCGCHENEDG